MKTGKYLQGIVLSLVSIVVAVPVVQAEEPATRAAAVSFGTIVGVVTNAAKIPVGGATVTAVRAGGGIRSTVSSSDGVYSFADLPPGVWSLTVQVDGYPEASVPSLQVVPSKATRRDVVMNVPAAVPAVTPSVAALPPAAPPGSAGTAGETDSSLGVGRARLRLSFSADSWVDVHDSAGRRVFAGSGRANSVKTLGGNAPLRVYLGFASGVQLELNGRAVAIGPQFVSGDVARFEAGADGVLRRDAHSMPTNGAPPSAAPPRG